LHIDASTKNGRCLRPFRMVRVVVRLVMGAIGFLHSPNISRYCFVDMCAQDSLR